MPTGATQPVPPVQQPVTQGQQAPQTTVPATGLMNGHAATILQLFAGKVFRVPAYQRNYSWDKENWQDFWDDIIESKMTGSPHYWGTITLRPTQEQVLCEEEGTPYQIYDVVDGQQRITTIYLFLLALASPGWSPVAMPYYLKCGSSVYRLELGGLNSQHLKSLADGKNPAPQNKTNHLLSDALEYFKQKLGAFAQTGQPLSLYQHLQSSTITLEFDVNDPTLAIRAFESLNDRGKQLTLLDKTKSFSIFYSSKYLGNSLTPQINTAFGNIFTAFDEAKDIGEKSSIDYFVRRDGMSEDNLLAFFYHYFASYAINKFGLSNQLSYHYDIASEDVFQEFLKNACNYLRGNQGQLQAFLQEFVSEFENFALALKQLIANVPSNASYRRVFSFLGINAAVYPLIIGLQMKGWLTPPVLDLVEALDVRVYKVRGTDPRAPLYRDVVAALKANLTISQAEQYIKDNIQSYMSDAELQVYLQRDFYRNAGSRYMLWEFEKYQKPNFNSQDFALYDQMSIDHALPEEPTFSFPTLMFQDTLDYLSSIHKVGNLFLLEATYNKSAHNIMPAAKTNYYQLSKIPTTVQTGFAIQQKGSFDKQDITNRTANFITFCLQRWRA